MLPLKYSSRQALPLLKTNCLQRTRCAFSVLLRTSHSLACHAASALCLLCATPLSAQLVATAAAVELQTRGLYHAFSTLGVPSRPVGAQAGHRLELRAVGIRWLILVLILLILLVLHSLGNPSPHLLWTTLLDWIHRSHARRSSSSTSSANRRKMAACYAWTRTVSVLSVLSLTSKLSSAVATSSFFALPMASFALLAACAEVDMKHRSRQGHVVPNHIQPV